MNTSKREKAGLSVFALLTALFVVSCVQARTPPASGITFRETNTTGASPTPMPQPDNSASSAPVAGVPAPNAALPAPEIVVHITGAVKKPGVYHLAPGARGDDALKAAGGPTADANPDALNLAAHLEDGSQIHVPTHKEQTTNVTATPESFVKHDTGVTAKPNVNADKPATTHTPSHSGHAGRSGSGKLKSGDSATININTANAEALQKLPGIGPSMAERILDYRKSNGGFKSPEELMQVSGIGPKKFAKIETFVRVR